MCYYSVMQLYYKPNLFEKKGSKSHTWDYRMATIDSVEGGSIPLNELQVRCEVDDGGRRSIHTLALQTEAEDGKSQANCIQSVCSQLISTSHSCSCGISNSRMQSEPEVNGVESDERVGQQPRLLS